MDQVNFNTHGSNLVFLNGQAVIIHNNNGQIGNVTNIGSDILHQALSNVSPINNPTQIYKECAANTSVVNNNFNGIYIVEEAQKENKGNLLELSLQDAADLGLQFALGNANKTQTLDLQPANINGTILLQEEPDKTLESNVKSNVKVPLNSNNLSDLLQFPILSKDDTEGFTFVPNYVDGQVTYQLQLPESTLTKATTQQQQQQQQMTTQRVTLPISCNNVNTIDLNNAKYSICSVKTIPSNLKVTNIRKNLAPLKPKTTISITKEKPPSQSILLSSPGTRRTVTNNLTETLSKKIIPISNGKNPIRKLTPSQLKQIAAVLEKNKSTSNVIDDSTRIMCRILYPEDFAPGSEKAKIDNLRKKWRTKKTQKKRTNPEPNNEVDKKEVKMEIKPARTRSGRLSRPPRHMSNIYKRFNTDEDSYSNYQSGTDENIENAATVGLLPDSLKRNISSEFRCPTCNKIYLSRHRRELHFEKYPDHRSANETPVLEEPTKLLGVSTAKNNKDPEWNKRRTGRGRYPRRVPFRNISLKQMVTTSSEQEVVDAAGSIVANNMSTWDLMLLRLENVAHVGKGKVVALIEELEGFVNAVKKVSQDILQTADVNSPDTVEIKDESVCAILGVKQGFYKTNDKGLIKTEHAEKRTNADNSNENDDAKRVKQDIIAIDDEETYVKEELGDTSILQDIYVNQSDLESVDQIVNERLETLAPCEDLIPNLSSLQGTEDIMAGLLTPQPLSDSIMFTPPVSESTEDLYKSLENFSVDIQPNSHTQLDFTDLSNEFNSGSSTDNLHLLVYTGRRGLGDSNLPSKRTLGSAGKYTKL